MNLFGDGQAISQDTIDFINAPSLSATKTSLGVISGNFSAELFQDGFLVSDLPVGIVVGSEYRKYAAAQQSDAASATQDEVMGTGAPAPSFTGSYDVWEAFAETIIPLVTDRPFIYDLSLEAGARYSHYSTAGSTFTWKAGGSYTPVPGLKFRGIYQRSERAPNIGELFDPVTTGLSNQSFDPCQGTIQDENDNDIANPALANADVRAICIAQGAPEGRVNNGTIPEPSASQVNATTGGNLDLGTESADSFTLGFVVTPPLVPGLSLTVDYYNIKVEDAITTPTPAISSVVASARVAPGTRSKERTRRAQPVIRSAATRSTVR